MRQIHTSPAPPASEFGLQSSTARMQAIGSLKDAPKPPISFDYSSSQPTSTPPSSEQMQATGSSFNLSFSFRGECENSEWLSNQPDLCSQPSSTADVERWLDELAAKQRGIDRPGDDFDNGDSLFKDEPGIARQVRTRNVPQASPASESGLSSLSAQRQAIGSSTRSSVRLRGEEEDSERLSGRPQYVPKDAPKPPTFCDLSFSQPRSEADVDLWLDGLAAKRPLKSSLNGHKRRIDRTFANSASSLLPALPGISAGGSKDSCKDRYEESLGMCPQHSESMRVDKLPEAPA